MSEHKTTSAGADKPDLAPNRHHHTATPPSFSAGGDKADFDGGDGTTTDKSAGGDKPDFSGGDK
jgi:hypothetical protein